MVKEVVVVVVVFTYYALISQQFYAFQKKNYS